MGHHVLYLYLHMHIYSSLMQTSNIRKTYKKKCYLCGKWFHLHLFFLALNFEKIDFKILEYISINFIIKTWRIKIIFNWWTVFYKLYTGWWSMSSYSVYLRFTVSLFNMNFKYNIFIRVCPNLGQKIMIFV